MKGKILAIWSKCTSQNIIYDKYMPDGGGQSKHLLEPMGNGNVFVEKTVT